MMRYIYHADREANLRAAKNAVRTHRGTRLHKVTFPSTNTDTTPSPNATIDREAYDIIGPGGIIERHIWKRPRHL